MRNRTELSRFFNELGFKVGAEVGVYSGAYSETLCKSIPNLKLYCIDPWVKLEKVHQEAVERLKDYNVTILHKTSLEAVDEFEDESLDFVYIDGNHAYSYVRDDIAAWTPKVRKGGIVAGHDYYLTRAGNAGVIVAVNDYVKNNGYGLGLTDWDLGTELYADGDDRTIRLNDEQQPSWWFIKDTIWIPVS
jgi:hypothetical protein